MLERARIRQLLADVVGKTCTSPIARRRLHYAPLEAFASMGLVGPPTTTDLAVVPHRVSAYLDEETLFAPFVQESCEAVPLEAQLVAFRAKPLALLSGPGLSMAKVLRWAERSGLCGCLSPHEYDVMPEAGRDGYFNLARNIRPARDVSNAWRGLLLGSSVDRAVLGYLALLFGWDAYLGVLLGYPACCVRAFSERWPTAEREMEGDVATLLVKQSSPGPFDWRLNILVRYMGVELLQHFPCTFDCSASLELGRAHQGALQQIEPSSVARIESLLASLVVYAGARGVVILPMDCLSETNDHWEYDARSVVFVPGCAPDLEQRIRTGRRLTIMNGAPSIDGKRLGARILDFRRSTTSVARVA